MAKPNDKKHQPGAPQGAALYDRRGRTLNSWGKYGQNIQAWYSSEFGLWSNFWHYMFFFTQNKCQDFTNQLKISSSNFLNLKLNSWHSIGFWHRMNVV